MRAPALIAVLGVLLAAGLGFAAHVIAQDTIGLPAVTLEGGKPLAPQQARRTTTATTATTETETQAETRTEPRPETQPRTDDRGGSSGSGRGSGEDGGGHGGDD